MDKGIERCCEKGKAPAEPGDWRLMSGMDRHTANDQLEDAAVQDGAAAESAAAEAVGEQPSGAAVAGDAAAAVDAAVTGRLDSAAVEGVAGAAAAVAEHAKTAKEYRQTADEHVKTLKDFWKDFLVSGIFILAAIVIIFACLAWFAANNRVNATGGSISAKGPRFALMVQDDVAKDGQPGAYHEVVSDGNDMVVDSESNFNNTIEGDQLYPGAAGQFKLKLHPIATDLRSITVSMTLEPYSATKQSEKIDNIQQLSKLLLGHIQFFTGKNGQYYTNPVIVDGQGKCAITIDASQLKQDHDFIVYWVWPERFVNFIAYGGSRYDKNLFAEQSDDYNNLLNEALNAHKDRYYLADSDSWPPDASASMTNADFTTCSDAYDKADDYIATNAQYLKVQFTADEVQAQPSNGSN